MRNINLSMILRNSNTKNKINKVIRLNLMVKDRNMALYSMKLIRKRQQPSQCLVIVKKPNALNFIVIVSDKVKFVDRLAIVLAVIISNNSKSNE